jgi:hypothetical protein
MLAFVADIKLPLPKAAKQCTNAGHGRPKEICKLVESVGRRWRGHYRGFNKSTEPSRNVSWGRPFVGRRRRMDMQAAADRDYPRPDPGTYTLPAEATHGSQSLLASSLVSLASPLWGTPLISWRLRHNTSHLNRAPAGTINFSIKNNSLLRPVVVSQWPPGGNDYTLRSRGASRFCQNAIRYCALHAAIVSGCVRLATDGGAKIAR